MISYLNTEENQVQNKFETLINKPFDEKQKDLFEARKKQRDYNRKRGLKVSRQVRQNLITRNELIDWWQSDESCMTFDEMYYFAKFRSCIGTCCKNSLFREHNDGEIEYIGSHTCDHKYCAVCNAKRSKNTRKAYRRFFETYPELLKEYDFMHLTLTVPHSQEGWRGQKFYAQELMKEYNFMRKKSWWKEMVYAGEFGVELTKNNNGLHIHIHSMLLVYKGKQNRNKLHRKILLAWNRQTTTNGECFKPLTSNESKSILKSNRLLTKSDIHKLNRNGATLIGLENLYVKSSSKQPGFNYCERSGFYKRYVNQNDNFEDFMRGVLECIKYHFEPMAMKENGKVNFDLMREILPMIAGKPLYRKFGAFHSGTKLAHKGSKMLNIKHKLEKEEQINEIIEKESREEVIHPETLKQVESKNYTYVVIPMEKVYFDPLNNYKPVTSTFKKVYTGTCNIRDALIYMLQMSIINSIRDNKLNPIRIAA